MFLCCSCFGVGSWTCLEGTAKPFSVGKIKRRSWPHVLLPDIYKYLHRQDKSSRINSWTKCESSNFHILLMHLYSLQKHQKHPKTNIASENQWLEDEISFWKWSLFLGIFVNIFGKGIIFHIFSVKNLCRSNCGALLPSWWPSAFALPSPECAAVSSGTPGSDGGRIYVDGSPSNHCDTLKPCTLPETNSSPLKIGLPKRKIIFQPSIFRCYVSFREGKAM